MTAAMIVGAVFGAFVFVMIFGGLIFGVLEMRRVGRQTEGKPRADMPAARVLPGPRN